MKELTDLALDTAARSGASYADIRIIRTQYESVSAKNEKVSGMGRGDDEGFGVRVIADGAWGYASSSMVTKSDIERIAAAAVDMRRFKYDSSIFCENGLYHAYKGGRISDHGEKHGYLTLADVVIHSSNIGMAKVGEALGNHKLYEVLQSFGMGEPTGVSLPGESRGIVRPLKDWDGYSMRRVPFGQEVSVTALQLTMAFCALANGGELVHPRIVDRVCGPDGEVVWRSSREVVRRVVSVETAAQTMAVLQDAVEGGTGKVCRLEWWTSFGKTGTAQVAGPGGYMDDAYTSTFIGGAPVSGPRALCLISIYRPDRKKGYYGATVAAPFVKQVLHKTMVYLDVPPDRPAQDTDFAARQEQ